MNTVSAVSLSRATQVIPFHVFHCSGFPSRNHKHSEPWNIVLKHACGSQYFAYKSKISIWTQDRRGHLKAPTFGQCCSQISEFYSSFSQLRAKHTCDFQSKIAGRTSAGVAGVMGVSVLGHIAQHLAS